MSNTEVISTLKKTKDIIENVGYLKGDYCHFSRKENSKWEIDSCCLLGAVSIAATGVDFREFSDSDLAHQPDVVVIREEWTGFHPDIDAVVMCFDRDTVHGDSVVYLTEAIMDFDETYAQKSNTQTVAAFNDSGVITKEDVLGVLDDAIDCATLNFYG